MILFLYLSVYLSLFLRFSTGSINFDPELSEDIFQVSPQGVVEIHDVIREENLKVSPAKDPVEKPIKTSDSSISDKDSDLEFYINSRRAIDINDALYDRLSLPWTANHYLPAYEAALKGDLKKLKVIKGMNISLDKYDLKTGETPLHAACRRGNTEVLDFICSHVKNLAPLNRSGKTPFAVAVIKGNANIVYLLLRFREQFGVNIPDLNGITPIMHAALNDNLLIFRMLVDEGFDYLSKDRSGRGLLSSLLPSNVCYSSLLNLIKKSLETDRVATIIAISPDLSFLYRNGFKKRVADILHHLGVSINELVLSPQPHSSNILMAILDNKDYELYRRLRFDPVHGFDINTPNVYDDQTFFNRCLEVASKSTVEYLISNDNLALNFFSYNIITERDDLELLNVIERRFGLILEFSDGSNIVELAGINSANRCFKHLLKTYSGNITNYSSSLFCNSAIKICESLKESAILNLFDKFCRGLVTCTEHELKIIKSNLRRSNGSYTQQIIVLNKMIELKY